MSAIENTKNKVQRILTNVLGSVRIDQDGDFVVDYESAVVFVSVREGFDEDSTIIRIYCPMVCDVPITCELTRWIAIEGQRFNIGGTMLTPSEDGKTAWIYFRHHIIGDDLDESELINSLFPVVHSGNKLDDELQARFGGTLFKNN